MSIERRTGKELKEICISACAGLAVFAVLLTCTAALMPQYPILIKHISIAAQGSVLIGTLIGTLRCSARAERKKLLKCLLADMIMLTVMIIGCAAQGGSKFSATEAGKTVLVMLIGSFAGTILGSRGGKRKPYQRKYKT